MNKINIINIDEIANDISPLVDHISSLSAKDKKWFSKVYFREVINSQHYAAQYQDESATHVNYVGSSELTANAQYIMDWLAGLQERDPKQHSKLPRITFQQALGHSKKWHAELAKQAEKSDRYIEPDAENAPKVLDLGEGWEVFWLKTKIAKEAEGEIMGHCVGSGAYDYLCKREAIFSIRKYNESHITLHMNNAKIKQAVTKGNGDVPDRYQHLVDEARLILGTKLFVEHSLENASPVPDGWHKNGKGDKVHIKNGLMNSDGDLPAVIEEDGTQEWYKNNNLHRLDGPSILHLDGTQEWYKDGKRHRDDGPAVIEENGRKEWRVNGKLHRLDGPAVIWPNGSQFWYKNGKLHRLDGPAIIKENGLQIWYQNDLLHRLDGPAVIDADGKQKWCVDGKHHRLDGPAVVYPDGAQIWYKEDNLHRLDGPAVIYANGDQFWYENGLTHRDDGPAVVKLDGYREWRVNNKLHRMDGPAVIRADGTQKWCQNGRTHREDGPAVIHPDGSQEWWINGKRHREDGPAIVYSDITQEWFKNGKRHREDGPAIIKIKGTQEWWIEDKQHTEEEFCIIKGKLKN